MADNDMEVGDPSLGTVATQSDSETETDNDTKHNIDPEIASETAPSEIVPYAQDVPFGEKQDIDEITDEAAKTLASTWETQSWNWERRWVEIERCFVSAPLTLCKWVKVPIKDIKISKNRPLTVETGKDGKKVLFGGFMRYYCHHPGCGKVFPALGSLRKHMHIHGEKQFVCPVENCGKRFLDSSKLKRHMAIHFKDT